MKRALLLAGTLSLAGCTLATAGVVIAAGQLVCASGPTVLAMISPDGAAFMARGTPKAIVDLACASIGGVAVSPPPSGVAHAQAAVPPEIAP